MAHTWTIITWVHTQQPIIETETWWWQNMVTVEFKKILGSNFYNCFAHFFQLSTIINLCKTAKQKLEPGYFVADTSKHSKGQWL